MLLLEVLGPGCARCNSLEDAVRHAAGKLGIDYNLVHVTDVAEFAKRGVMLTPALLIDGKVVVSGRVPSEDELIEMLRTGTFP